MKQACLITVALFLSALSVGVALASPPTFVQVVSGSGELQQWGSSANVEQAQPLTFRWWTTGAGTTQARWDVELQGNPTPIATGTLNGSPGELNPYSFTLPAQTFLAAKATSTPVNYTLHVTALNGSAASQQSDPVTIIEGLFGQANVSPIPLDTNPASKLPPPASPEPGHPLAKLIAYRPIPAWGAGAPEGMITLEFSSPISSATDPVSVSLSDLNQVVQQTDLNVIVPSLPKGGFRFRVAIALGVYRIAGDDADGIAWMKRYAKGPSLLVGTAMLHSPYVQYQQPPILTGATSTCVDGGCAPNSPPWLAVFRPTGLTSNNDENIAVGQGLVYLEDYNDFAVYDKNAHQYGPVDLTSTLLAGGTPASQQAWKGGGDATLFQMFWFPGERFDVNPVAVPTGPIPCDPSKPSQNGQPGFDSKNTGISASSCINQFYDARLTYDAGHGRFWLLSHAANDINPSKACTPPANKPADYCQRAFAQVAHQVFVAVSKSEAPSDGFLRFDLDNANVDWPLMGVQGRYLLISYHHPGTPLRLYDADALVQGVQTELGPLSPADFGNGMVRMPKHRNIKHDLAFIVSTSGATLNLYAWNAAKGSPRLLGPAGYTNSSGAWFDTAHDGYQSVIRSNYLYVTTTDGTRVLVWRIPFGLSPNGVLSIDGNHVGKWAISQSNRIFDYPTIEVTRNGDIVVAFRAWNTNVPDQLWVDVLYHGETQFRHSMAISSPATQDVCCQPGNSSLDFISSSIDPADDETVWIISVDGTGTIVTSVRP